VRCYLPQNFVPIDYTDALVKILADGQVFCFTSCGAVKKVNWVGVFETCQFDATIPIVRTLKWIGIYY